jgi:hypothetical protein
MIAENYICRIRDSPPPDLIPTCSTMRSFQKGFYFAFLVFSMVFPHRSQAQKKESPKKHAIYFSWGYNTEWYTKSNVSVSQPALGNHYTFEHISGHDHRGWDDGIFNKAISIPQYNYRLGWLLNRSKGLGIEINFDHTKFIFADQNARIRGTLNKQVMDTTIAFNAANGFFYYLNNGANFLLIDLVKYAHLYENASGSLRLDFLGKAGAGPVIPHVENSFFGEKNTPHFQLGGWNLGLEASIRISFFRYVFLEYANKLDYARYSGLQIYEGTARQAFGTYEMILTLGFCLPVGKTEHPSP